MTTYSVGDLLEFRLNPACEPIRREIVAVRESGYDWRYPDLPIQVFASENSSDPLFEYGWKLVPTD